MESSDRFVVLVTGDRDYTDKFAIAMLLDGLLYRYGKKLLVAEGEADGADTLAKEWCIARDVEYLPFPAHWRHGAECSENCKEMVGRPAGAIRNRKMYMISNPNLVLAFHDDLEGKSKGTLNMVTLSTKGGTRTYNLRLMNDPSLF